MLRELLGVLQQQHENGHAMKLEWIVIWLIIVSSGDQLYYDPCNMTPVIHTLLSYCSL